jgi:hypothetical protein
MTNSKVVAVACYTLLAVTTLGLFLPSVETNNVPSFEDAVLA